MLWDTRRYTQLAQTTNEFAKTYLTDLAFSPHTKSLAVAYGAERQCGGLVVRDVRGPAAGRDKTLTVAEGDVYDVAFSPDGSILAGVCWNGGVAGGVVLWDGRTGMRLADKPLKVGEGYVNSVAFSPNGKTLAAGYHDSDGADGGVVLWDTRLLRRLAERPLVVAEGSVRSLAFSPDGKTLAAGFNNDSSGRSGVVLLDLDLESWKDRARKIANRNLTREEWRQFFPETPYHAPFADLPVPPEEKPSDTSRPGIGAIKASDDKQ